MLGRLTAGILSASVIGSGGAAVSGIGAQPLKPGKPAAQVLHIPKPTPQSNSIRSGSSSSWGGGFSGGGFSSGK